MLVTTGLYTWSIWDIYISISIYLYIHRYTSLYIFPIVCNSSICEPCLSIVRLNNIPLRFNIYLSIYLSIYIYIYISIYLSIYLLLGDNRNHGNYSIYWVKWRCFYFMIPQTPPSHGVMARLHRLLLGALQAGRCW